MKNIFQNKKVLIATIVIAIVVVLAIVLFVVMGMSKDKKKSDGNNTIKFNETSNNTTNKTENKTSNKTSNKTDNKTDNEVSTDDDDDIGGDIDKYYKTAAKKFAAGFMDKDDMQDFLESCVDVKAFVAYENIEGDESKFEDEYASIDDNDPKIAETEEAFAQLPGTYEMAMGMIDAMMSMAGEMQESGNNVTLPENELTEEDKLMVLKDISKPKKSSDNSSITSIDVTYAWMGEDAKLTMIFFDDVVIYICDEDGKSVIDSAVGDFETGFDDEEN